MRKRHLLALLLAIVIVVTEIPVQAQAGSTRLKNLEHKYIDFSGLEYEHLGKEQINECIKVINSIGKLCNDEGNKDEIEKLINWAEDELFRYLDYLCELTVLNNYIDPYDEYWAEEYSYIYKKSNKLKALYEENLKIVCKSVCKDVIDKIYGKGAVEEHLREKTEELEDPAITALEQQYYELIWEYRTYTPSVEHEGVVYTLESMWEALDNGLITEEELQTIYVKYWYAMRLGYADIYLRMIKTNNAYAKYLGYDNYLEYEYEGYGRKETPAEAVKNVETILEILEPYRKYFGIYYNDLLMYEMDRLLKGVEFEDLGIIAEKMAPEIKESYDYMMDTNGCIVLPEESTVNPYANIFFSYDIPYMVIKDTYDMMEKMDFLLHEFGHYNSLYWNIDSNDHNDFDQAEVYSQAMELLSTKYYEDLFGESAEIARKYILEYKINVIYNPCINVIIENLAYTGDFETAEELVEAIDKLLERYSFAGYEWFTYSHFYSQVGYFYSYVVSALTALELFEESKEDYDGAIDKYIDMIAYYDLSLEESLEKAGLTAVWTEEKVEKLFEKLMDIYIDNEPPVIKGAEDGKVYTESLEIEVRDVTETDFTVYYDGEAHKMSFFRFVLGGGSSPIRIVATDLFGNTTDIEFMIEPTPFTVVTEVTDKGEHKLSWKKHRGATQYVVYGATLGKKYRKLATLDGDARTFVNEKADDRVWKYYVEELYDYGEGNIGSLGKSYKSFVVSEGNSKYTNIKEIEIEGEENITLKKDESTKMSVKLMPVSEDKKVINGKKIKKVRYHSSDKKIATVDSKGKITAVSEGVCYVYCIAENGIIDRIRVSVS